MTNIKYYPEGGDRMWNEECSKIAPYIDGVGLDVCCGARSLNREAVRVDIDPKKEPDILCSADELPLEDESVDYVYSIHGFEHLPDQQKTLKEWLRVVKKGGYIAIVHPDVQYTGAQKPLADNPGLQYDPHNKHYVEETQDQFIDFLHRNRSLPFTLVDFGEAQKGWSFFVVLRKK